MHERIVNIKHDNDDLLQFLSPSSLRERYTLGAIWIQLAGERVIAY